MIQKFHVKLMIVVPNTVNYKKLNNAYIFILDF